MKQALQSICLLSIKQNLPDIDSEVVLNILSKIKHRLEIGERSKSNYSPEILLSLQWHELYQELN